MRRRGCLIRVPPFMWLKEWFSEHLNGVGSVRRKNGQECGIVGIGEIPARLHNGSLSILHQVRHIPNLKRSLIFISMMAEDKYKTTLSESSLQISKGILRIGHGVRYNYLSPLTIINREGSLNVAKMSTPSLWHGRLSHMSQTGVERTLALDYIMKLNHAESYFYEHCQYRKHTQIPHSIHYETIR